MENNYLHLINEEQKTKNFPWSADYDKCYIGAYLNAEDEELRKKRVEAQEKKKIK